MKYGDVVNLKSQRHLIFKRKEVGSIGYLRVPDLIPDF